MAIVVLHREQAVIDGLAGKIGIGEFEFVPLLFCAMLHRARTADRVRRQAGHPIRFGMLQNVAHFPAEVDGALIFVGHGLRHVGMIVVIMRDIDSVQPLDDALALQPVHFIDHFLVAAIHQECRARFRNDQAGIRDGDDPGGQFLLDRFRNRHPRDGSGTEHARRHAAYLVIAAIPAQRVDGEMAGENCLEPPNEGVDRVFRIVNHRSAHRNQNVRLPLQHLAQALDDVSRARRLAVVTVLLHFRNRILQAE